jgi:hypothetical protein
MAISMSSYKVNPTILLLLFGSVICLSPVFLGVGGHLLSLTCLLLVFVWKRAIVSIKALFSITFLLSFALFNTLYWGQPTLKAGLYFYVALIVIFLISHDDLFKLVHYLTKFLSVMIVAGIIGFIYAYFGGEAQFEIANEDGRPNGFYLTTFSSSYYDGVIRPSAIFDEPGALSFIICICVALRESLGMPRKESWVLMVGGFITLSTAHTIFFVLYWMKVKWKDPKTFVSSVVSLVIILMLLTSFDNPFNTIVTYTLNRFSFIDGVMVGDNRSELIVNSYRYLDIKTFLFGLDSDCIMGSPQCILKGYKQYCCNPLTPLVHIGFFLSFPYYICLGYLMYLSLRRIDLVILGVILLLLQRPYLLTYGYSLLLVIYVYSLGFKRKDIEKNDYSSEFPRSSKI